MEGLEIHAYHGRGYQPLVRSQGWMVALLNYETMMSADKALDVERHLNSDEVFILIKGRAALYIVSGEGPLQVVEMIPGVVYNVLHGVWHNLLASEDVSLAIVENQGTDLDKTASETRLLSVAERQRLLANLPAWQK
jgi:mannose-6-phosphate isomerase-like protein (cupin superfamily)